MSEEKLILVDYQDRQIGTGEKLEVHRRGLLHRAFSVFLFDGNRLLIQKRVEKKYHCGGLIANTCCSHPRVGESVMDAAVRRLDEECGIKGVSLTEQGWFIYRAVFDNGLAEYEADHILTGTYSGGFAPDPDEIAELKWIDIDELETDMIRNPGKYAPWFFTALSLSSEFRKRIK